MNEHAQGHRLRQRRGRDESQSFNSQGSGILECQQGTKPVLSWFGTFESPSVQLL